MRFNRDESLTETFVPGNYNSSTTASFIKFFDYPFIGLPKYINVCTPTPLMKLPIVVATVVFCVDMIY